MAFIKVEAMYLKEVPLSRNIVNNGKMGLPILKSNFTGAPYL